VVSIARMFNEPAGQAYLVRKGVPEAFIEKLNLFGFSGVANMLSAIKFAKYYEMGENDVVLTVLTDSMELYGSRIEEMRHERGEYLDVDAAETYGRYLQGTTTDAMAELTYESRKRIHNLKYYTWVEQQGKTYQEIQDQWYDENYWSDIPKQAAEVDALIEEFNHMTGLTGK